MRTLLSKSFVVKPIIAIMILAFTNLSFTLADNEVILKAGTLIPLEVLSEINTKNITTGQIIDFKVTKEICVDKNVVIPFGAIAKGQVSRFEKRKGVGKGASIQIQLKSVTAKDGTDVMLTGGNMSEEGENNLVLSIVLAVFVCPLFLLLKGKQAVIPAGTSISATVATDTYIKL
ncbi:hypothetical protein [Butyricimonas synergistica]|uniref:hypothetical protein n=1 Tax=Butyricimonas synergistica TaxID=544644 RepID=UPI00035EFA9A|nr:hypothetical protein [Butyricimonas synergistica]